MRWRSRRQAFVARGSVHAGDVTVGHVPPGRWRVGWARSHRLRRAAVIAAVDLPQTATAMPAEKAGTQHPSKFSPAGGSLVEATFAWPGRHRAPYWRTMAAAGHSGFDARLATIASGMPPRSRGVGRRRLDAGDEDGVRTCRGRHRRAELLPGTRCGIKRAQHRASSRIWSSSPIFVAMEGASRRVLSRRAR